MKLLTATDRVWGLAMTGAVYGALGPALLMLGTGIGHAPVRHGVLKTFDVALPRTEPDPTRAAPNHAKRRMPNPQEPAKAAYSARRSPSPASAAPAELAVPKPIMPDRSLAPPILLMAPPPPPPPPPPPEAPGAVLDTYAKRLWSHIAAKRPAGVHLEGTTGIAFNVTRSGAVENVSISSRSGNPVLDRLAVRVVRQAAPLPVPPDELGLDELHFTICFDFR